MVIHTCIDHDKNGVVFWRPVVTTQSVNTSAPIQQVVFAHIKVWCPPRVPLIVSRGRYQALLGSWQSTSYIFIVCCGLKSLVCLTWRGMFRNRYIDTILVFWSFVTYYITYLIDANFSRSMKVWVPGYIQWWMLSTSRFCIVIMVWLNTSQTVGTGLMFTARVYWWCNMLWMPQAAVENLSLSDRRVTTLEARKPTTVENLQQKTLRTFWMLVLKINVCNWVEVTLVW